MVLGILRDLIPYHINAQQKPSSVSKSAMKIIKECLAWRKYMEAI
jgi:hypothetical protein